MKKVIFIIMLLVLTLTSAFAVYVEIGTGEGTSNYVPDYGLYDYGWSRTIYLQTDLLNEMEIHTLSYNVGNTPNNYIMENQSYYIKHTTSSSIASTDYIDPTTDDSYELVYSGSVTYNGSGWHDLFLDTVFEYNGIDNLEILVINNDGTWVSSYPTFVSTNATPERAVYEYADGTFPTTMGTLAATYPNTRFHFTAEGAPEQPFLVSPENRSLNNELDSDLVWTYGDNTESIHVYFSDIEEDVINNEASALVVDGDLVTTYSPTLENATTYYWKVIASNSTSEFISITGIYLFSTTYGVAEAPYSQDFEDVTTPALPLGWMAIRESTSNYSYVDTYSGASNAYEGVNSLRMGNSSDVTGTYIAVMPQIENMGSRIKFWAKCTSINGPQVIVGYLTDVTDEATFIQIETVDLTSDYQEHTVVLELPRTVRYLAFKHANVATYQIIYLDNILIEEIPENEPTPATLLTPENGATNVALNAELTWEYGINTAAVNLWLSDNLADVTDLVDDAMVIENQDVTSYTADLEEWTTYYWRVGSLNSTGYEVLSGIYSFISATPEGTIQIGSGTETNTHLPMEPYYGYSLTQSIYNQEWINVDDQRIEQISYYYNGSSAWTEDNIQVYLGHTDLDEFTTSDSWVSIDDLVLVYDGPLTVTAEEGWVTIPLFLPFNYNNEENLLVAFEANTSGYFGGNDEFYCTTTEGNNSIWQYSDSVNSNFMNPVSGTVSTHIPNVVFTMGDIPTTPELMVNPTEYNWDSTLINTSANVVTFSMRNTGLNSLVVNSVSIDQDVDFILTDNNTYPLDITGGLAQFTVTFHPLTVGDFETNIIINDAEIGDTVIPLTGTGYDAMIYEFPHNEGFENIESGTVPQDWNSIINSSYSNPTLGVTYGNASEGNQSLRFSNYNDLNAELYAITPPISNVTTKGLSFYAKASAQNTELVVGVSASNNNVDDFIEIQTISLTTEYQEYSLFLNVDAENVQFINFKASSFSNSYSYVYLDNVTVEELYLGAINFASPSNYAKKVSINPTISFGAEDAYTNFELYLSDTPDPEDIIIPFSPLTDTVSYSFQEPLEYFTDYYWTVVLYNEIYEPTVYNFTFKTMTEMEGAGTEESPYLVNALEDLQRISLDDYFWNKYYLQVSDFDASNSALLNDGAGFNPIASGENDSFTGSYDGQGYAISNLTISSNVTNYIGLFGKASGAELSNIGLVDVDFVGGGYTGGLVGFASNINISDIMISGDISGNGDYVGGLVGYIDSYSTINNSFVTGVVSGQSDFVGGLVGRAASDYVTINNSYTTCSVFSLGSYVGGLVGHSYATVNTCYSVGAVTGSSNTGGLVGTGTSYLVSNSFWDRQTSGQTTSGGGTSKTTVAMKSLYTYLNAGWDFIGEELNGSEDIWYIHPSINFGYPFIVEGDQGSPNYLPNYPTLSYPDDGVINLATSDNLLWDLDFLQLTSGYKLNLGTDNPPSNLINNQDLGFTTSYDYSDLEAFTTYYWKVIPYNESGEAEDCPIWSFTTGSLRLKSVGNGPDTIASLPVNPEYVRSYSQSIYLQSEINLGSREIEKLSFYVTDDFDFTGSNQWRILFGQTDKTEFIDANDWLLTSQGLTEVANKTFSNSVSTGWLEIELTTPFVFNNSDNLIVSVIEYGSAESANIVDFYTVETENNRSLTFGHDSITPNPNIPYAGTLLTSVPKINFNSNAAPTIEFSDSFTFAEDSQLTVDMSEYTNDDDGDQLTLTVSDNENINVTIDNLLVTFNALENWSGSESLTFTISDGVAHSSVSVSNKKGVSLQNQREIKTNSKDMRASSSATVSVIVTPVNDAPTIELPVSFTFAEDSELLVDMSQYLADIEEDELTLTMSGNENIQAEISGLMVTLSASPDWNGTEEVTFTVDDNITRDISELVSSKTKNRNTLTRNSDRLSASSTINIIVTPENDAPTIELPASFTFAEDGELLVDISDYTLDIDQDELTLLVSGNENITATVSGMEITIGALADWFGTEEITITVNDSNNRGIASATTDIIVTPVNDAPTIALPASFTFAEDSELLVDMSQYLADIEEDELTLTMSGNENIQAEISGLMVTLSATLDWNGTEEVTFTVNDNNTRTLRSLSRVSSSASINIIVTPENDAPTIQLPASFTFAEDGELLVDISEYTEDIDGDELTLLVSGNENITATVSGMEITLGALADWFGTEEITITVNDSNNRAIASATTDIIVTPVNDAPTIELPASFTFAEDSELLVDMSDYVADIDEDELTLTMSGNENIQAEISGLMVTLSATLDWNGTEEVTFTVNDNNTRTLRSLSRVSSSASIDIIVTPVNDTPTIELPTSFTFAEDGELLVDVSEYTEDIDGDELTLLISGNENIIATVSGMEITLGALADWFGTEEIAVTVNDNHGRAIASATTDIIVTPVNDAPNLDLLVSFTFVKNNELTVNLSDYIIDVDGDPLTISVTSSQNIFVDLDELMATFSATLDWYGTEQITFTVSDGVVPTRATSFKTIDIVVTPSNNAPTIDLPESFTFPEDGELLVDISEYSNDINDDELTVSVSGQENILVTVNTMEITLGAVADWFGTEEITVTVNDNYGRAIASSTTDIIVTPVNDGPTITLPASFTFVEDGELIVDMNGYIADIDEDNLTISVNNTEDIIALVDELVVTFSASADWFGIEEITVTVNDNNNRAVASATTDIIVTPVNDAPTIELPASFTFVEDGELIIDISEHSEDIDQDELTLTMSGSENIQAEISQMLITLSASPDWFGTEEITLTVNDNIGRALASATTDIIVTSVNDAPTIDLPESFTFAEDGELIVDVSLYIEDLDEDELSFTVSGQENITATLSGTEVTLGALENWFGTEEITITVNDGRRRDVASAEVDIIVTPVNDQPNIISFNPTEIEIEVILNDAMDFSISAGDVDSDINYSWYVNDVDQENVTNEFTYQFMESLTYEVTVIVSDEEYSVEHSWNITVPVSNDDNAITPLVTGIMSNYPNPFNPDTNIKFSLGKESLVQINIYDLKGKVVRNLHNGYNNAGVHTIAWNGLNNDNQGVASGVYYVRMKSAEGIHTRKITLMK